MDEAPDGRGEATGAGPGRPLRFAFWDVCEEIVRDNVARFTAETGLRVEATCIRADDEAQAGPGLGRADGPDVFHAQRAQASLWAHEGLIQPLDESHRLVEDLVAGMDGALVDGARDASGRLLGATYYNGGPLALFLRPGEDAAFERWGDLVEACRKAKRDGRAEHPFVPRWHSTQTGLVWSLLAHLAGDGVTDFAAPDAEAVLSAALATFRTLVVDELVPPDSLFDRGDRPALERWSRGRHLATLTADYLAKDAGEIAGRPVCLPAARLPGRTGTPLMPGHALICLRAGLQGPRQEAALRLAAFLGGPSVHRRWLEERLFAVPRASLLRDPGVRRAVGQAFAAGDRDAALERLVRSRARAVVSPITHQPFMLAWSGEADRLIRGPLLRDGSIGPDAAARRLLDIWERLGSAHREHRSS